MALSATFSADFSSFEKAVESATTKVVSFEASSNKVKASLERMEASLSGKKLIQDATLAAEAVERIGGVSKLTADELTRLGAQAQAAADKMRVMGIDVPPGIQKIADATKQAAAETTNWQSVLTSAAGAFGVAFSVSGAVSFATSVLDTAGKIHDLSMQLGISTEAVQGFKAAAEGGGSTLDAVGAAITRMNAGLAEGGDSTRAALTDLGLKFETIRAMKPEDAFLAITDAVAKIEDPMKRTNLALEIFGKSAASLLPAIIDNFRKAADEAEKMSDRTIGSLARAGDAWQEFRNKVVIYSGGALSATGAAVEQLRSGWQGAATFISNAVKFGVAQASIMADAMAAATEGAKAAEAAAAKVPAPVQRAVVDLGKMREELLKAEAQYRGLPPTIDKVAASSDRMGEATVRAATRSTSAIRQMADGLDDVQRKMNAIVEKDKAEAAAKKAAAAAANATAITTQIVGRVTPLSEREAADTGRLESWIAGLTRKLAASGPVSGAGPGAAAAAQQRADDERQLEYLKTLLDVATAMARSAEQRQTAPVTVHVQASGFFDSAAKRELATVIGDELMSTLKLGRQLGTG